MKNIAVGPTHGHTDPIMHGPGTGYRRADMEGNRNVRDQCHGSLRPSLVRVTWFPMGYFQLVSSAAFQCVSGVLQRNYRPRKLGLQDIDDQN